MASLPEQSGRPQCERRARQCTKFVGFVIIGISQECGNTGNRTLDATTIHESEKWLKFRKHPFIKG
jgi:hypothetical protein